MSAMTNAALLARLSAATAAEQGEALLEVLRAAFHAGWVAAEPGYFGAYRMLAAGAYESAALVLVPDGAEWHMHGASDGALAGVTNARNEWIEERASTPALAIAAACVRAQSERSA